MGRRAEEEEERVAAGDNEGREERVGPTDWVTNPPPTEGEGGKEIEGEVEKESTASPGRVGLGEPLVVREPPPRERVGRGEFEGSPPEALGEFVGVSESVLRPSELDPLAVGLPQGEGVGGELIVGPLDGES